MDNQMLQFAAIFAIGVVVPFIITTNKGFNLLEQKQCGINDIVLNLLEPVSEYLHQTPVVLNYIISISSALLDIQYLLTLLAIARRRRVKHAAPFALMYTLRFIIQRLSYLPFPGNSAWRNPGTPTLVVFYEEVGDFYPSGHVAFPLLAALYHNHLRECNVSMFAACQVIFQTLVVLATRTHYTIDCIGGALLSYCCWQLCRRVAFPHKTLRVIKHRYPPRQPEPTLTQSE